MSCAQSRSHALNVQGRDTFRRRQLVPPRRLMQRHAFVSISPLRRRWSCDKAALQSHSTAGSRERASERASSQRLRHACLLHSETCVRRAKHLHASIFNSKCKHGDMQTCFSLRWRSSLLLRSRAGRTAECLPT